MFSGGVLMYSVCEILQENLPEIVGREEFKESWEESSTDKED
ncbi:hypothetical protein UT300012_21580 [Paraclostridium bifermentans]